MRKDNTLTADSQLGNIILLVTFCVLFEGFLNMLSLFSETNDDRYVAYALAFVLMLLPVMFYGLRLFKETFVIQELNAAGLLVIFQAIERDIPAGKVTDIAPYAEAIVFFAAGIFLFTTKRLKERNWQVTKQAALDLENYMHLHYGMDITPDSDKLTETENLHRKLNAMMNSSNPMKKR